MRLNFATPFDPMQETGGQGGTPGTACNYVVLTRPHLPGNDGDMRGQAPTLVIEGQAETPDLSPMPPNRPQSWGHGMPSIQAVVPIAPNVPEEKHMNEIDRETFEKRAAIKECNRGPPPCRGRTAGG